jgi:hypothetical protein
MRFRHPFTALCVAISSLFVIAGVAQASPITVNVRIEGARETLFEGPIAVEPHGVRATSDSSPKLRSCNGINSLDPLNTVPAPTSTSSSADAMALIGETFDGKWYPGFNDYFVTRFGPDREAEGKSWGILVNNTFTNVGGCQYQLDEGDEVLWIYNAFDNRKNLGLFTAGSSSGTRSLTAKATLGVPFEVEVRDYEDNLEDNPPAHPELTGSVPFGGAYVSPVVTNAKGFQRIETSSPETAPLTAANGRTSITFTTPGWHRIKATVPGAAGKEEAVFRSNRIDVCVEGGPGPALEGATECSQLPLADQVRVPPPTVGETEAPGESSRAGGGGGTTGGSTGGGSKPPTVAAPAPQPGPLRVSVPTLDRGQLSQGKLTVRWKVIDAGAGVKGWTISSQTVGQKKARWVKRASGTKATRAALRLPRGHAYRLRFTITDATGKSSNVTIGKVRVPKARVSHARHR